MRTARVMPCAVLAYLLIVDCAVHDRFPDHFRDAAKPAPFDASPRGGRGRAPEPDAGSDDEPNDPGHASAGEAAVPLGDALVGDDEGNKEIESGRDAGPMDAPDGALHETTCGPEGCPSGMRCCNTCDGGTCVAKPLSCPVLVCGDCAAKTVTATGSCSTVLGMFWDGTTCSPLRGCACSTGCDHLFAPGNACAEHMRAGGCLDLDCTMTGCPDGEACELCWVNHLCGPPGFGLVC